MSGAYEIIYADFPWPYTSFGTAHLPYRQMTEFEISNFDFKQFMAKNCVLFSWATCPKLDMAFRAGEAWKSQGLYFQGVSYVWVKTTHNGAPIGASGPRPRLVKPVVEMVLAFSTKKNARTFPLQTEAERQLVFAPKSTEHSRKPAEVRDRIVGLLGDRPRIELFARGRLPDGWDGWGDEYER